MRKYILFLLFVFIFVSPYYRVFADATLQNVGFVSNPIWYSSDPFYEGDMVKIYTFIFNGRPETLSGSVDFYDGDVILGKKSISLNGNTGMDASISWKVTMGDHKIYAKISSPKILVSGKYESVSLENSTTDTDSRSVPKKILSASQTTMTNPQQSGTESLIGNGAFDKVLQQLTSVENSIKNSTPDIIQKPIIAVADNMENYRLLADGLSAEGKSNAQNSLDLAKSSTVTTPSDADIKFTPKDQNKIVKKDVTKQNAPKIQKPFEYIKLYFWSLIHFITSNRVVFYGLTIVILFFIIRAIVRKIMG